MRCFNKNEENFCAVPTQKTKHFYQNVLSYFYKSGTFFRYQLTFWTKMSKQ